MQHDDIVRVDDLRDRMSELEAEREQFLDETCEAAGIDDEHDDYEQLREETVLVWETQQDDGVEWSALNDVLNEIGSADYLVHEDHFVDYVEEMLRDCGDVPSKLPWYVVIDWESTAKNIRSDYSEVEIDGITYYYQDN